MLKEIFKEIEFKPLHEYISKLESKIDIIDIKKTNGTTLINCKLDNDLKLDIIILYDQDKTNIAFNYKTNITLEKIEFMILKNRLYEGMNRTIRHDYWILENNILTTYNSFNIYLNDENKKGKENIRKVNFTDIKENILYDNLSYLALHIDDSKVSLLYKEENDNKEPNLKTIMLDSKKYKRFK